jgi:hypothetical protein
MILLTASDILFRHKENHLQLEAHHTSSHTLSQIELEACFCRNQISTRHIAINLYTSSEPRTPQLQGLPRPPCLWQNLYITRVAAFAVAKRFLEYHPLVPGQWRVFFPNQNRSPFGSPHIPYQSYCNSVQRPDGPSHFVAEVEHLASPLLSYSALPVLYRAFAHMVSPHLRSRD